MATSVWQLFRHTDMFLKYFAHTVPCQERRRPVDDVRLPCVSSQYRRCHRLVKQVKARNTCYGKTLLSAGSKAQDLFSLLENLLV